VRLQFVHRMQSHSRAQTIRSSCIHLLNALRDLGEQGVNVIIGQVLSAQLPDFGFLNACRVDRLG
jgi:hypothetical protein